MKSRFSTFDIKAIVRELQQKLISLRVVNVYDINSKTYLIKLAKTDEKAVLLLESGIRLHTTEFEWPKNVMPSGFSMKLRKHLKGRRLEKIEQLGVDRIVDMQFGSSEAAYHVILELYDRGNIILTDYDYSILSIQRPRTDDSQEVRFAVRERYPLELAKQDDGPMAMETLMSVLTSAAIGDNLKKILNPHLAYGASLIEHCLISTGLNINAKLGHDFRIAEDSSRLLEALNNAEEVMKNIGVQSFQGYIIQQKEKAAVPANAENEVLLTYSEYHPFLFKQHENLPYLPFSSFDQAVDEFFSKIESQKQDRKVIQQEKTAYKKLDGIKNEHVKRLDALKSEQEIDIHKAELIEINLPMVDRAITVIRSALANQIDWPEIQEMIEEASQQRDPVALSIKSLKLDTNHFTMLLRVPDDSDEENDEELSSSNSAVKQLKVDIDLGLSAYANARKYYDLKRHAAVKEQKTVDATEKAMKSAERKTKLALKEVRLVATINKARKTFWFEKFLWFISSENYIVIGGRDQQQNELIVKRYLKPGDLYVHADLHGASSVVIKNPSKEFVPPKTLNEAGAMALCYSAAWDARVVTSSWWVHHDQVSKTAPSGEYLTTGSFMIRGKKNYLPPSHLIFGFGFLFKVDDSCVFRHKNERRVRSIEEEDAASTVTESTIDLELKEESQEDDSASDDDNEHEKSTEKDGRNDDLPEQEDEEHDIDDEKIEKEKPMLDDIASPSMPDTCDFAPPKIEPLDPNNRLNEAKNDEPCEFPDTSIQLYHVKGGEFALKRENSVPNQQQTENKATESAVLSTGEQESVSRVARLSAKQRREMKKKKNEHSENVNVEIETKAVVEETALKSAAEERLAPRPLQPPPQPAKRGQKGKLKKIKEKYGDQDEEERLLKMELLASSGGPKEEKPQKGKKGKPSHQQNKKEQQSGAGKKKQESQQKPKPNVRLTLQDIKDEQAVIQEPEEGGKSLEVEILKSDDVEEADDGHDGEEESNQILQDSELLSSLTSIPDAEDLLLFCVSVCAPYTAMVNYKYKVKLMPGTTKRGKAAKLAVNMFLHDKAASSREKDLVKSLKDTDLSRNMPGKVKVSAPNLYKQKHR